MRWLAVLLGVVLAVLMPATPAHAAQTTHRYVVDTTYVWPVEKALADWDASPYVRLRVVESCDRESPTCHYITDTDEVGTSWVGLYYINERDILLAHAPLAGKYWMRRQVVCHEVGHSLGLMHKPNGCMREGVDGWHPRPTAWQLRHAR